MSCGDVTIVIRLIGERTAGVCRELLAAEVGYEPIEVISERPFSRAVERTLQLGIERGRRWTVAVDADILAREHMVRDLVALAEQAPDHVFEVQGRVLDKVFGGSREGGPHLFRTSFLPKALSFFAAGERNLRPEAAVILEMDRAGHPWQQHTLTLGLHDYEQFYGDLVRKGFAQDKKHGHLIHLLEPLWRRLTPQDADYRALLVGLEASREQRDGAPIDSDTLAAESALRLRQVGLTEKPPLIEHGYSPRRIHEMIERHEPSPEFIALEEYISKCRRRPNWWERTVGWIKEAVGGR